MKKIENIKYAGNGCELDVFLPDCEKFPVFVFFHGGGLTAGDKSEANAFWEYLVSKGVAVVSANYRTYPDAVYDEFLRDGAAAVAWVKNNINNYGQCNEIYVGRTERVLVHSRSQSKGILSGRTSGGKLVHFEADESLIGSFATVEIIRAQGYYLQGKIKN